MGDESELMEVNSDSSDSPSDNDDEEEKVLVNKAEDLERQLAENKYLYDIHLELVNLYRKLGDLKSMRYAYERFHEYFPLTPQIWLEWIEDEKKLAVSNNDMKYVMNLFEQAVKDYASVVLWQEYAQYSIGTSDTKTTREILEKGLTIVGLNAAEGSLLWDTLRELELAHLSIASEGTDEWKEQLNRVVEVFRRQLSVPLMGMESTYAEWQEFYSKIPKEYNLDPKPIEWGYNNALKKLETCKPFEEKLATIKNQEELYPVYKDYIKILSDPSTVVCVYERAVAQMCLEPTVWLDYCTYALKLGESVLDVVHRGLRNCPWSQELWVCKLRFMEHFRKDYNEVLAAFEDGISTLGTNLELWLSFLEYARRGMDSKEKLAKLFEQAVEQLQNKADKIIRFYVRVLAKNGDMPKARQVWKKLANSPENKGSASVCLEFANLERFYGDVGQLRSLYQRALNSCKDFPHLIAEEWMMFEREVGSLEDSLKCEEKCRDVLKSAEKVKLEEQPPEQEQPEKRKRKFEEKEDTEAKKQKFETPKRKISKDPKTTVFVSNLYPSINEKKLKKVFPNAQNIEIVHDRLGKSRCYGYVEFTMEEEVMTALARDRELLDGRPMFISTCKPDKIERNKAFKYSTTSENNKLFVKNIPHDKTKEDLEKIFKPLGAIDVRLVMKKNGESKGLAYVEFPDEEAAKKALEKSNNMKIGGNVISVAVSAPPQKATQSSSKSLAPPTRHARSRLNVPLIPRALQVGKKAESSNGQEKAGGKSNEDFRKMLLNNK